MLTLKELEDLLVLNEKLSTEAVSERNFVRMVDLMLHRAVVKDMIINLLKEDLLKASSIYTNTAA